MIGTFLFITTIEVKDTTGDINVSKQTLIITGNVKGDVLVGDGSLIVQKGSSVKGDILIYGDSAIISGKVNGDAVLFCDKVIISDTLLGDVVVLSKSLMIDSSAFVKGDVVIVAPEFQNNGKIEGEKIVISFSALPELLRRLKVEVGKDKESKRPELRFNFKTNALSFLFDIIFIIILLITTFLTFLISRGFIPKMFEKLYENPLRTIVTGLVAILLIIPILILLAISIIGILLIPVYLIFLTAFFLISLTFGFIFIGRLILSNLNKSANDILAYFIGLVIVILLYLAEHLAYYVDYLDLIAGMIVSSFIITLITIGLGSLIRIIFRI